MKTYFTLFLMIFFTAFAFSQPPEIKAIMAKQKADESLTEEEELLFENWLEEQVNGKEVKSSTPTKTNTSVTKTTSDCPRVNTSPIKIVELTKDTYIALSKGLMSSYGPKTGDLPKLKSLLESSSKTTDGSDVGAVLMLQGAGSASIYAIAFSAVNNPLDVLTANNLGIALKDRAEFTKALQVLKYADKLKPNTGLILCNLGWVYREMGDNLNAKIQFEKALSVSPKMTSPYLGLGLIAKCEGNFSKAEEYLRKALTDQYSSVGFAAYKKAKESQTSEQIKLEQSDPISDEKGEVGELNIPEMPISEKKEKMAAQKQIIENYQIKLNSRLQQLIVDYESTLSVVKKQQLYAYQQQENAIVFNRDFEKELMQIADITDLLFGPNSNYAHTISVSFNTMQSAFLKTGENALKIAQTNFDKQEKFMKQLDECGDNDACIEKVKAEIDEFTYELCVQQKGDIDTYFGITFKTYKSQYNALTQAVNDYYAFTNPIIEKIYSPSFNELQNIYRQLFVLSHEESIVSLVLGLPEQADEYNHLMCVEPKPQEDEEPEPNTSILPTQNANDCGVKNLNIPIGILTLTVTCDQVKILGGNGALKNLKRDSQKHEISVIGKSDNPFKIQSNQGDTIKNIEIISPEKTGMNGLEESNTKGRMAVEGGPEAFELAPLEPYVPEAFELAPLDPVGIAPLDPVAPEGTFELAPLEPVKK